MEDKDIIDLYLFVFEAKFYKNIYVVSVSTNL